MTHQQAPALAACLLCCAAAFGSVQGPVSGYVLDARTQVLRPVNGFPGAATLGVPLALPFPVRLAAIGRDYALIAGSDANDRLFLARDLSSGAPRMAPLDAIAAPVTRVVWNADGNAALVYSQSPAHFQVITGLPDAPRVSAPIDPGPLNAGPTAMALNAAADRIIASGGGGVYEYSRADGDSWDYRLLASADGVSSILFRNAGHDVVFASQATNEIMTITDFDGAGGASVLAGSADGVDTPVAMQAADGDRELWVANAGSRSLLVLHTGTAGSPQQIPLSAVPSRCDPLDWNSVLVLNEAGSAPLLLLDWARERTVFFVPLD